MIGHRARPRQSVLALATAILTVAGLAITATPAQAGCSGNGLEFWVNRLGPKCLEIDRIGKKWRIEFVGSYDKPTAGQMVTGLPPAASWLDPAVTDPTTPGWEKGVLTAFERVSAVSAPARPLLADVAPGNDPQAPLLQEFGKNLAEGIALLVTADLDPDSAPALRDLALACFRAAHAALDQVAEPEF